jgi:hypothetical protein
MSSSARNHAKTTTGNVETIPEKLLRTGLEGRGYAQSWTGTSSFEMNSTSELKKSLIARARSGQDKVLSKARLLQG